MAELYLTGGAVEQPYDFSNNPAIKLADLLELEDPCVLFEGTRVDSDGVRAYLYTVGGFLRGEGLWPGHTVEGDIIIVHANSRGEADEMAGAGLLTTIEQLSARGVDAGINSGILTSAGLRAKPH